jgi:TRAP-type C4-dicarboxylate transport system substrate-binding protein
MNRSRQRIVTLAVAAALVAGCASQAGGTKAGGSPRPVTLRLGTPDNPNAPSAEAIKEFARRVEQGSEGEVRIEPVWEAQGRPRPDDFDQAVARMVTSGKIEMGMIPARAWDTEGVTSLRALNTPFLVTSEDLVRQIVTSDVATDMLDGLDTIGITGLELFPESMRHVFSFGRPLLSLDDFDGATIRVPLSNTVDALFTALGASAQAMSDDTLDAAFFAGSVTGAESSFISAENLPGSLPTATGNLTLFPKLHTLVINAKVFGQLTPRRQALLRDSAKGALDAELAKPNNEASSAQTFCGHGGRIVSTSDADLAAIEQAARPVIDQLEQDAATKATIARIRDLKAKTPTPAAVAPCNHVPATTSTDPVSTTSTAGESHAGFPKGVYRMEITFDEMIQAGVSTADALNNAGVWTLTFDDGALTIADVRASDDKHSSGPGVYCVADGRVIVDIFGGPACGDGILFSAAWTLHGDELRFSNIHSATGDPSAFDKALWGSQPWKKIG